MGRIQSVDLSLVTAWSPVVIDSVSLGQLSAVRDNLSVNIGQRSVISEQLTLVISGQRSLVVVAGR